MADWATISSLATAGGTLVLAVATFSAVRSSNRSARIAEQALEEQRRAVLAHTRPDDPSQRIVFGDGHWIEAPGGGAAVDVDEGRVYLGLSLRNVGAGIAVLQGWHVWPERASLAGEPPAADGFRRQLRDIYIAAGDLGLWQGALRDADDDTRRGLCELINRGEAFSVDLLYTNQVGGQPTISRFAVICEGERWSAGVTRHWNLDGAGPR